jgi:hypothetical protein
MNLLLTVGALIVFALLGVAIFVLGAVGGFRYANRQRSLTVVGIASRNIRAGEMVHAGEILTSGTVKVVELKGENHGR